MSKLPAKGDEVYFLLDNKEYVGKGVVTVERLEGRFHGSALVEKITYFENIKSRVNTADVAGFSIALDDFHWVGDGEFEVPLLRTVPVPK